MTDPNFERSLRAAARRGRPGGVHPEASLLAAYVDRGLSDTERAALETHVADCAECMERLALLGSVNVPDEPDAPILEWSPRQLLSRWGWLVPIATVVVLVAVWERQPSRPASGVPASPGAASDLEQVPPTAPSKADEPATELALPSDEEPGRSADVSQKPAPRFAEVPRAKDASVRPELQAGARHASPPRGAPPAGGAAAEGLALRDKKEVDAVSPLPANKVAAAPAAPPSTELPQTEAAASAAGRADEAKPGDQRQAAAVAPMREATAQGALLKSAIEPPAVLASGPGVSIRRSGSRLERSTDNGMTWTIDLADAPDGLRVGACPAAAVCWLGGAQGIVLVRQGSGSWTRHVVADGRAAVTTIEAADGLTATVRLSDGRSFHTSDGGATWVLSTQ